MSGDPHWDFHVARTLDATMSQRTWVIVLLNLDQCTENGSTRCVMEAHGPYTSDEAHAAFDTFPRAFAPHIVCLRP